MDEIEEAKKFLIIMNSYDASIYKWVYARKINYNIDPKYNEEE